MKLAIEKFACRTRVVVVALIMLSAFAQVAFATKVVPGGAAHPLITNTRYLCSNLSVPGGYVVTNVSSSTTTSCAPYQQWTIGQPGAYDTQLAICSVSPNLPNWVITYVQSGSDPGNYCAGYQPETITKVTTQSQINVCGNSPTPSGWVIDQVSSSGGNCAQYQPERISKLVGTTASICSISPIPSGWAVVYISQYGGGCANYEPETINLASGTQMSICSNSPIPSNWYISANGTYGGSCAQQLNSTMRAIQSYDTQLIMCGNSPLPTGWYVSRTESSPGSCSPYVAEQINRA